MGYTIKHDVEWPDKRHLEIVETKSERTIQINPMAGQRVSWKLLWDALAQLEIGDVLNLSTENPYIESARKSSNYYAAQHNVTFATETHLGFRHGLLTVKRIPDQGKEL